MKQGAESNRIVAVHTILPDRNRAFLEMALDHGKLVEELKERDMAVVSTDKSSFTGRNGKPGMWRMVDVAKGGGVELREGEADVNSIGALQSRNIHPHTFVDKAGIPQINPTALKNFAGDKSNMIGHFADHEIPTQVVSGATIEAVELDPAIKEWAIKPAVGNNGKGFRKVDSADVMAVLADLFLDPAAGNQLVQPYIGTGRIPRDVYGASASDRSKIDLARSHGAPSEMRAFVLGSARSTTVVPILRIATAGANHMKGGNNEYVDVEVEGRTAGVLGHLALSVSQDVVEAAGVGGSPFIAAVDVQYDGEWYWVVEANFRSPGLPTTADHPHAARTIYPALADTLEEMIEGSGQ